MPNERGVIGHGMPYQRPGADSVFIDLHRNNAPFIDLRQSPKATEPCTLSEALDQAKWDVLLPQPEKFKKYVDAKLYKSGFKSTLALNILLIAVSFLFLTAFIGLLVRATVFATTKRLSDAEEDAETTRVYTDGLGYFLGPFIITFSSGVKGIYDSLRDYRSSRKKSKEVMEDYVNTRNMITYNHNLTSGFFAITAIIHQLQALDPCNIADSEKYRKLIKQIKSIEDELSEDSLDKAGDPQNEQEIGSRRKKIDYNFELLKGEKVDSILELSPQVIANKLRFKLNTSKFYYVTLKIREDMKKNISTLANMSILQSEKLTISKDYLKNIDIDARLHNIIIDIIGEIASDQVPPSTSHLIKSVNLMEESTLSEIRDALITYWNGPQIEEQLIHPFDVDLGELALLINTEIRQRCPELMLQSSPQVLYNNAPIFNYSAVGQASSEAISVVRPLYNAHKLVRPILPMIPPPEEYHVTPERCYATPWQEIL